ncbi:conserved hypothetical protein [Gluconacetobacter diazotrophicus PA1 5]|uniref:Uncharacterized protein n=1 Tax=Gluconacetobacter diazotrophicus (strain ATCC 49037 / DSM 5601 / CCUG 37298 / CIP 103539 / LMG 7603 / PAl5) TaxID=272568 RepID=A9H3X9_GLUDA|nr:DUF4412 domain-containing protein [Gluconacetobacter diazotrophicus]ACI52674.1 conserved hypothetical protein [Gluconacetobacter diazotrophicus PA1 5]TWB06081.1 uncharacterized protein DUF4412 [Gluconacetobacter diazotrophicus]CAP57373.1 Unknown protein [Gluconacetobacter diazotrophicus PA1 5]
MTHPTTGRAMSLAMLAGVAVAFGAAAPAHAQNDAHPPLAPARDVQVEYNVQPDGAPAPKAIQTWFTANGGMMRIDSPEGLGSTILDRAARQVTIVLNKQKVYTQLDARNGIRNPFLLDLSMQFTRKGTGQVAGLACTVWDIVSGRGTATACVTDDGVILREDGVDGDGMKGRLEATKVTYGPLPVSLFQPPQGYQLVMRHRVAPSHDVGGGQPVTGGAAQPNP